MNTKSENGPSSRAGGLESVGRLAIATVLIAAINPARAETPELQRFATEEKKIFSSVAWPCFDENERAAARIREAIEKCDCPASVKQANLDRLRAVLIKDGAACELRGNEAVLGYIASERSRTLDRLRAMQSQLDGVRRNYESWTNDAKNAQSAAIREFQDFLKSGTITLLVAGAKQGALSPIESKMRHFKHTSDLKLLPELEDFARDFGQQARGKSAQEVKALVLATLNRQRQQASDAIAIGQEALSEKATEHIEPTEDARFASSLDTAYSRMMTVLDISITQGLAPALKSFDKTIGLIAFAPDIAKVSLEYFELAVDSNNLEALEGLRKAAEGERTAASKWLPILNDKERTLKARQEDLRTLRSR